MLPSQQRFKTADAVGLDIDQRLVVKFELAVSERAAQIDLHVAALLGNTIHLALEEPMHAAAVGFRPIEPMSALRISSSLVVPSLGDNAMPTLAPITTSTP